MASSEIWALVGVVTGTFLGFGLNLLRDCIREEQQRRKYLQDLLGDLEYNKKLAEKDETWGYHTLGYIDAKGAKYLFSLPNELRNKVYDAQTITSALYEKGLSERSKLQEVKKLKKLLEEIIPEFKKYLKK